MLLSILALLLSGSVEAHEPFFVFRKELGGRADGVMPGDPNGQGLDAALANMAPRDI